MPVRTPSYNEILAISLQTGEGVEAAPVTGDVMQFINAQLVPAQENLVRTDKGLGRSRFGYVAGGNIASTWDMSAHLTLPAAATPVSTPQEEQIFRGALGAAAVSINTTVAAAPAPTATVFTVGAGVGATLKVGDPLTVNIAGTFQVRPITAIATDALTFSPGFTAAPASGAVAKARIYRLGTNPNYYTMVKWFRDTADANTAYTRKAIDAVFGELDLNFNQSIINIAARGPAAQVVRTSIPAIPTLPSFTEVAKARNFGDAWLDTTKLVAYEFDVKLNNQAVPLPVPFGKQVADSVMFGIRQATFDLVLDGQDTNSSFVTDSENKTNRALFAHSGNAEGGLFAVSAPKINLTLAEYAIDQATLRLRFAGSGIFASAANNELAICIG